MALCNLFAAELFLCTHTLCEHQKNVVFQIFTIFLSKERFQQIYITLVRGDELETSKIRYQACSGILQFIFTDRQRKAGENLSLVKDICNINKLNEDKLLTNY